MMLDNLETHIHTIVINQMEIVSVEVTTSIIVVVVVLAEEEETNQRAKYVANMGTLHWYVTTGLVRNFLEISI